MNQDDMNHDYTLHHAGLLVADLARAQGFYEGVLGLKQLPRPNLLYPGIWYALGTQQLHLMQLPNPDAGTTRPEHGGRDRHLALGVADFDAMKSALDAAGVSYTQSRSGRAALFCRDPDANTLELVALEPLTPAS